MMPSNMNPHETGISAKERAVRIYGTLTHFVALHLHMGEIHTCPETWEELHESLVSTGAHFGQAPNEEDFDIETHEAYVPEVYSLFRLEILASGMSIVDDLNAPLEHKEECRTLLDKVIPEDPTYFLQHVHLSMVVRDSSMGEFIRMAKHRPDWLAEMLLGPEVGEQMRTIMNGD